MIVLKYKNPKQLKSIFSNAAALITECKMKITPDYLGLDAMDPSHIALVNLRLLKSQFEEYAGVTADVEIPVNLPDIKKILDRSSGDDNIILRYDENTKDLTIELIRPSVANARGRKFKVPLKGLDFDVEEINFEALIELEHPNAVKLKVSTVDEAIKDAKVFSEIMTIETKKVDAAVRMAFTCVDTLGDMEYNVEDEDMLSDAKSITTESKVSYSLNFLDKLIDGSLGKEVTIFFGSESPMRLDYQLDDAKDGDHSLIRFFLAPRVDEDDAYDSAAPVTPPANPDPPAESEGNAAEALPPEPKKTSAAKKK